MFNSVTQITYRKKRQLLILLVLGLFVFLFYRGLELHLDKSMTDRIRFHAIPVAMSVLYHKHPHDYTGLHAIAMPFQGPGNMEHLIKIARRQTVDNDSGIYYWVADDKGFEDFVIAAFYLFGSHVISMYYMWFLVLFASISFYIISFGRQIWALSFLCLILVGVHVATSSLAVASVVMTANEIPPTLDTLSSVSLYEPRYLDVLALVSVFHMILFAARRKPLKGLKEWFPLFGQVFIFIFLYHARSSLGWEVVSVLFSCLIFFIYLHIYSKWQKRIENNFKSYGISGAIAVAAILSIGLLSLNGYKHVVYNSKYFAEMGTRTIWHNALMGLGADPLFAKKFDLGVSDLRIAQSVIQFARKKQVCAPAIEQLEGQILLNSLGNWGVADWVAYEDCAKKLYLLIVSQHKLKVAILYGIKKPLSSIKTLVLAMKSTKDPLLNSIRIKSEIGWYPFSILNLFFVFMVFITSLRLLLRIRANLLILTLIVFLTSFIPSVAFYPDILTQGGMLATSALLLYLLLAVGLQRIWILLSQRSRSDLHNGIVSNSNPSLPNFAATKKLSIVVPAYNEEKQIILTMQEVHNAAQKTLDDFEIIIVDDGSTDATYSLAVEAAKNFGQKIKVISQKINLGVGAAFHIGLEKAIFPQLCLIPGDNAYDASGIELLFSQCGTAPLIISYRQNMETRTPLRHFLSRVATIALRLITGLKIKDAHSLYLFPVEETKRLGVSTTGYGYHIEILSRLLARLRSFTEVPVILNPKPDASSGVMKPKTLLILGGTICKLFWLRMIGRLQ